MLLERGRSTDVPFLLVENDYITAAPGREVSAVYSTGAEWITLGVTEVGDGWYVTTIPAQENTGFVIVRASAPDTCEWRDVHQVVDSTDLVRAPRVLRAGVST